MLRCSLRENPQLNLLRNSRLGQHLLTRARDTTAPLRGHRTCGPPAHSASNPAREHLEARAGPHTGSSAMKRRREAASIPPRGSPSRRRRQRQRGRGRHVGGEGAAGGAPGGERAPGPAARPPLLVPEARCESGAASPGPQGRGPSGLPRNAEAAAGQWWEGRAGVGSR